MNFAGFDVSIPSERNLGEVAFPKGRPDPKTDVLVASHSALSGEREFIQSFHAAPRKDPTKSNPGAVFVHGHAFRRQALPVLAESGSIFVVVSSDAKALAFSARLRGQKDRLGSSRSVGELDALDVTVIDLGQIKSEDMFSHLKIGTSPEVIGLIQSMRAQGIGMLSSQEEPGLIDSTVGLLRIGSVGLLSVVTSR